MSLTFPTAKFQAAMLEYAAATKKDGADILNRALRNVGMRAAQFTPKNDTGKVETELRKDQIGLKMATRSLRGRVGKSYKTKKGKTKTYGKVTRKQIAARARQIIQRRQKRTGFMKAGWLTALLSAGIPIRGQKGKIKDSKSKLGSGKQATSQRLYAYLGNAVYGRMEGKAAGKSKRDMEAALLRAIRFVIKDMTDYARKEMAKTAAKHSGRKR